MRRLTSTGPSASVRRSSSRTSRASSCRSRSRAWAVSRPTRRWDGPCSGRRPATRSRSTRRAEPGWHEWSRSAVRLAAVAGEARIEQTDEGAVVSSPGWFVLNLADTVWQRHERAGTWTDFEGGDFEQYGIGVHALGPGKRTRPYPPRPLRGAF